MAYASLCLRGALVFLFLLFATSGQAESLEPLAIGTSRGGVIKLKVEIADTPMARAQGLMERNHLPENQGMLFIMPQENVVRMWMKNTPLPLDMLFINRTGTIIKIATAVPHSTDVISAQTPALAVLEIGGGLAKKWGVKEGDKVEHRAFQ